MPMPSARARVRGLKRLGSGGGPEARGISVFWSRGPEARGPGKPIPKKLLLGFLANAIWMELISSKLSSTCRLTVVSAA